MKRKIQVERSSGNVFADIGIANPEEALAKAEIARQVNKIILERGISQSKAADLLGIDQPRVSALSNGRLSLFSMEKMMQFASRLGNQVEISLKPSLHAGLKVVIHEIPEQHIVSTAVIGGQQIELSFVSEQQYGRPTPIKLDKSDMVSLPENVVFALVA